LIPPAEAEADVAPAVVVVPTPMPPDGGADEGADAEPGGADVEEVLLLVPEEAPALPREASNAASALKT
jgi:hypothetical protein